MTESSEARWQAAQWVEGNNKWYLYEMGVPFLMATDEIAAKALVAKFNDLEAERDELRIQRRKAWTKLGCRCLINGQHEKIAEDSHCPYHGGYNPDPENWSPLSEAEAALSAAKEELNTFKTLYFEANEAADMRIDELDDELSAANQRAARLAEALRKQVRVYTNGFVHHNGEVHQLGMDCKICALLAELGKE